MSDRVGWRLQGWPRRWSIGCSVQAFPESLRVFMLSMAAIDDLGAIFVLAIGYGGAAAWGSIGAAPDMYLNYVW